MPDPPPTDDRAVEGDTRGGGGTRAFVFVRTDSVIAQYSYLLRVFSGTSATARAEGLEPMLLADDPPGFVSRFAFENMADPVEREGELARRAHAPHRCSRLGGVFVFGAEEACRRAHSLWGWDLATVRSGTAFGPVHRHDMMLSSALKSPGLVSDDRVRAELWNLYWEGAPGSAHPAWDDLLSTELRAPLWELLVDGAVQFDDDDASPFASGEQT